jgi:hypothetical protein
VIVLERSTPTLFTRIGPLKITERIVVMRALPLVFLLNIIFYAMTFFVEAIGDNTLFIYFALSNLNAILSSLNVSRETHHIIVHCPQRLPESMAGCLAGTSTPPHLHTNF